MFKYITAGQTEIIDITIVNDPVYESLSFFDDFGEASDFATFDSESGEVTLDPDESVVGEFELKIIQKSDSNEYVRTMFLTVEAITEEEETKEETVQTNSTDPNQDESLFFTPDKIIISVNNEYRFNINEYITDGLGTVFDKVELLQLSEFASFDDSSNTILIKPVSDE